MIKRYSFPPRRALDARGGMMCTPIVAAGSGPELCEEITVSDRTLLLALGESGDTVRVLHPEPEDDGLDYVVEITGEDPVAIMFGSGKGWMHSDRKVHVSLSSERVRLAILDI